MGPIRRYAAAAIAGLFCCVMGNAALGFRHQAGRRLVAQHVRALLDEWRVDEAHEVVQRMISEQPNDPETDAARGVLSFFSGDYTSAAKSLDFALRKFPRKRASLIETRKLIQTTEKAVSDFIEQESMGGHFRLRVAPGKDEVLLSFAAATLEHMRTRLEKLLGYVPAERITVEIYERPQTLALVTPLTVSEIENSGTIALCNYNRLMVVSPKALLRGYPWLDTLAHEYVHLVIGRMTHNRVPVWIQEGIAKYLEQLWRLPKAGGFEAELATLSPVQRHLLATAQMHNKLISWQQMHPSLAKLPNQEQTMLAFAQAQTAVAYLVGTAPAARLRVLLSQFRDGVTTWQAVQAVTGENRAAFNHGWQRYLQQLNLKRLSGFDLPRLSFQRPNEKSSDADFVRQRKARRHFRLAELLRGRNLKEAASVEYEKANTLAGGRHVTVATALARSRLELNRPQGAIAVLNPVLKYYPDLASPQIVVGMAQLSLSERTAAKAHLLAALRINPFDPQVHCGLAQCDLPSPEKARHAEFCRRLSQ